MGDTGGLIEESDAIRIIRDWTGTGDTETVTLRDGVGRIVRSPVNAQLPWPVFDNSMFDGYALGDGSLNTGGRFKVKGEQPAGGNLGLEVGSGEAVRIFTGAPLPQGTVAVAMQEDVERADDTIVLGENHESGDGVRLEGSDFCRGQLLIRSGSCLDAGSVALLASQGIGRITVGRRPRVALVSTGDELAVPGQALEPGQIYESNLVMLQALLGRCAEIVSAAHAKDTDAVLRRILEEAMETSDVVVITGGVSVGDRDRVRPVLREIGTEQGFWRMRVRPGKPLYFGRLREKLVFGLPGNPASSYVCARLYCRPALRLFEGASDWGVSTRWIEAGGDFKNRSDRLSYFRVRIENDRCYPHSRQRSDSLLGLKEASLIRVEAGVGIAKGGKCELVVESP